MGGPPQVSGVPEVSDGSFVNEAPMDLGGPRGIGWGVPRKTKRTPPRSPHNIEPLSPFFYWGNKFFCVSFPLCVALLKTLPRNSISIFEVSADTPKMEILLRKNVLSNATRHQAALLVGESIDIRPVQEVVTCACSHA